MTDIHASTVGEIVRADYRTAGIFENHGIDFCCNGDRRLSDACAEKAVDVDALTTELQAVMTDGKSDGTNFADMTPTELVAYIVEIHHGYCRRMLPVITAHADRVAQVHGENHPEVIEVARLWRSIAAELEPHLMKEELVLFPMIDALVHAHDRGATDAMAGISGPIRAMMFEHASVGERFDAMRALTSDFSIPADACMTYTALYRELKEFESDLHRHIHLENNVLFPACIERANAHLAA